MNRCAVVVTHHKTGTVWMSSVFRAICRTLDIRFYHLEGEELPLSNQIGPPAVLFSGHPARLNRAPWLIENPEHRMFHLIRDPRDVIISAMQYHRKAKEIWLHVPQQQFSGATYQQHLNSLPDDSARLLFEMDHSAGKIIRSMHRWNYGRRSSIECKYEQLVADKAMRLFSRIISHLGFETHEFGICWRHFWRHSLFGRKSTASEHINSGEARQWSRVFTQELGQEFLRRFGDVLIALGYEFDNSWLTELGHLP